MQSSSDNIPATCPEASVTVRPVSLYSKIISMASLRLASRLMVNGLRRMQSLIVVGWGIGITCCGWAISVYRGLHARCGERSC